ncbi:hypothetical protein [Dyella flagellata]|uniref:Lipoprotein n=1 Tax=Dyella flagellata TaxID=1867833 RepID=A0ABQ5X8S7_9GAMM|nr:hypothetical protein [Dyella flagellata]GLQ87571.1 hypothetical protein GCM10007898_11370 [Dyella flagellata]
MNISIKHALAGVTLAGLISLLSGCYVAPDYSYVRSSGYAGDVYYGSGPAVVYDYPYGYPYGYYGGAWGYYGCCYGGWYGRGHWRGDHDHDWHHGGGGWHGRSSGGHWSGSHGGWSGHQH